MKKSSIKCAPKASTRPLFNLVNNPQQPLDTKNFFEKDILKQNYQKALKKLTSYFLQNSRTKQAWNQLPVALLVTKQVQKNFYINYVLSDQV